MNLGYVRYLEIKTPEYRGQHGWPRNTKGQLGYKGVCVRKKTVGIKQYQRDAGMKLRQRNTKEQ